MDSQLNGTNVLPQPSSARPKSWLKENGYKLCVMIATIAVVCYFLHPLDVIFVCFGLGGIIFIHELGHFLAAKLCNVYVRTFSIGFGPAWPFCQYKYGETNYKIGMIPLGGYVAMAGESTGEVDADEAANAHDDDDHPRSFKNKPVWQRMIIISAGVIMNVILAAICFVVAYSSGVKEPPAIVQAVEPGSAGWQKGLRVGSSITQINDIDGPMFQDITPEVASTGKDQTVQLKVEYKGQPGEFQIEPIRAEGAYFPQLGIAMPSSVQLDYSRRDTLPPYMPDTTAQAWSEANPANRLLPGDTITGMTDPKPPHLVTPLAENWNGQPGATFDYRRRIVALAGKPITLEVQRLDSQERCILTLPPSYHKDTGLRMKIGKVVALRADSPAMKAGVRAQRMDGEQEVEPGDRIVGITVVNAEGKRIIYDLAVERAALDANTEVKLLDPLRMPSELAKWADSVPDTQRQVLLTVLRDVDHTEKRVTLEPLTWDNSYRDDYPTQSNVNSPVPLGPLGLAYRVTSEVNTVMPNSAAADAGVQPNDLVLEARFHAKTFKWNRAAKAYETSEAKLNELKWEAFKPHQWAYVNSKLQLQPPYAFDLKVQRAGTVVEVPLIATDDPTWAVPLTGLLFKREVREQRAEGIGEALKLGVRRTVRAIKSTYQQLYGLVAGRISIMTMSGPITLARASYIVAGEDWRILVLLCALISINLAVVNFLPIPVLDGGHMVFLLYEAIRGKQPPVVVQNALTIAGLVCVLCLMVFTVGLDLWRLFFV